jgi:hypothetical protein
VTDISLSTAPLTHSNPAKAVEGDRTGQGEVTLPPCCHWDSIFQGLPKQRSRDTTFLGADALHESSIGLSLEREAHMRNRYGGHHEIILAVD